MKHIINIMSKAGKKWSEEDVHLLKDLHSTDVPLEQISIKLGRNVGGIRAKLDQLGLCVAVDETMGAEIAADLEILTQKYGVEKVNSVLQKVRLANLKITTDPSAPSTSAPGPAPSTSTSASGPAPSTSATPTSAPKKAEELLPLTKKQAQAFEYFLDRKSFCLTGPGGTGKSYIIKHIRDFCHDNDVPYAITALTGVAASLIGGQTLHTWSGLGLMNKPIDTLVGMIKHNTATLERWNKIEVLVIDETSMMNQEMFELLHVVSCKVRGNKSFYGGIQVIFCCDFAQLAPIQGNYAFESALWQKELSGSTIYLNEVLRQDDPVFIQMLSEIRLGKMTPASKKALNARIKKPTDSAVQPTILYPHRKAVDDTNNLKLEELQFEKRIFTAKDTRYDQETKKTYSATAKDTGAIEERCPKTLALCEEAQVMLTINMDTEQGLVNGARGVVVGFVGGNPEVLFSNGVKTVIAPSSFESQTNKGTVRRMQIPLILAWATTIHKCQGSTLTHAITDLRELFCAAQGYVTLSRLKSLEGLYLIGIDFSKFTCDQRVVKYYECLTESTHYNTTKPSVHEYTEDISLDECMI
jgi:ATP-dependent DNA helicase PIF1